MPPAKKLRVLIADDHALLAEGIAGLLSQHYEVLGIASNGRQLIREATRLRPDLIVLDVSMPEVNGIAAAAQLKSLLPQAKLIFVTQMIDPHYLRAALRAGAAGYVSKQSAFNELLTALRQAIAGQTYVTPLLRDKLPYVSASEPLYVSRAVVPLTPRQREVLQLVAEG